VSKLTQNNIARNDLAIARRITDFTFLCAKASAPSEPAHRKLRISSHALARASTPLLAWRACKTPKSGAPDLDVGALSIDDRGLRARLAALVLARGEVDRVMDAQQRVDRIAR
jgi:hypothetical protein